MFFHAKLGIYFGGVGEGRVISFWPLFSCWIYMSMWEGGSYNHDNVTITMTMRNILFSHYNIFYITYYSYKCFSILNNLLG